MTLDKFGRFLNVENQLLKHIESSELINKKHLKSLQYYGLINISLDGKVDNQNTQTKGYQLSNGFTLYNFPLKFGTIVSATCSDPVAIVGINNNFVSVDKLINLNLKLNDKISIIRNINTSKVNLELIIEYEIKVISV